MSISVVMATYNGESFILDQLNSIFQQEKKPDEVIICDDKSSDGTVSIISMFIDNNKLNKTWKLIVNDENLGYCDNFKKVCQLATGDVIFFSDQDDIWKLDKIKVMETMMEENQQIEMLAAKRALVIKNRDIKAAILLLFRGLNTYYKKRAWLVELFLGFFKQEKS